MPNKKDRPDWMNQPTLGHGEWGAVIQTEIGALGVADTLKNLPHAVVERTKEKISGILFDDEWIRMEDPITKDVTLEHRQHGKLIEFDVVNTATIAGLQILQGQEPDPSTGSIPTQALTWMDPEAKKRVLGGNKK